MKSIEAPHDKSKNLLDRSKALNKSRSNVETTYRNKEVSIETLESNYKKVLADAREYFAQENIEEESQIPTLQEEDTKSLLQDKQKIEKLLLETEKALSETQQKYNRLKSKSEQLIHLCNKKVEKLEAEKAALRRQAQGKEQEIPNDFDVDIQEILYIERAKYKELENQVNKNNQIIDQLTLEKKKLRLELEESKKITSSTEKVKQKSKATLFDIISTFLIIGANFLFVFVIYPNIANWIKAAGLNDLPLMIRILITLLGFIIGSFCIVRARKSTLEEGFSRQKKRGSQIPYLLFGLLLVGAVLLFVFLFSSNFLFFIIGTLLMVLAGLLAVIDYRNSRYF